MKEKNRYFFVVALPRSGSTLLAFVLNSHSKYHVEHEDDSRPFLKKKERQFYNLKWKIVHGFEDYLDSLSAKKNYIITSRYYDKKQIQIIHNALDTKARYIILTRKHMWRVFHSGVDNRAVLVPLWQIWKFLICKIYIKQNFKFIEITYENMVSKPECVFSEICKFIGVDFEVEMLNYHYFNHSNLNDRGNIKTRKYNAIIDKSSDEKISLKMIYKAFHARFLNFFF